MNLFELFVKIGVDDQASDKLKDIGGKLGNGLKTAAKIGTAAVGAAAAGITALTTTAVNNYAEYEQLVGGVETLFKNSADTVMKYAENAYMTAGLSANEYMSTVTSFSASLLQSLGGDSEAAAEYADVAITDMADNANKMGTSIESLQSAYQGFAKQNYTMLDNLKLGYGGTKEEMQRLLDDAEEISGIEYDISSFADITEAIHVMQEEMGIAGATALEAGTTIEGSVNSMKSAWQNLLTGLADGNANIGDLISNLVTTVVGDGTERNLGVLGNILPAIETALGGIAQLIEGAAPIIIEILPGLIEQLVPSLISAATSLVNSVIEVLPDLLNTIVAAIIENAPMLIDSAFVLVGELISGILSQLPQITQLGLDLIVSLALGIANSLDELIPAVVDVILQIVDILTDPTNLSNLLDAALEILVELAWGLMDAIPQLVDACVDIIFGIAEFLTDPETLADLIAAALEIVIAIATGLINSIPELLESAVELVDSLIESFMETDWAAVGTDIINAVWEGLQAAWESIKSWFSGAWDSLFGGRSVDVDANAGTVDGSHAGGLNYVPYDGYIAELHRGERVLTAQEAAGYNNQRPSVNIVQNIYSEAKTAADLMQEAIYQQERAVMLGV